MQNTIENTDAGFAANFSSCTTVPRWQRKALANGSNNTNPSSSTDRFIPNHSSASIEQGNFQLSSVALDQEEVGDYQRAMTANLFPAQTDKVLAFSQAAPKPRDGYQGDMNVLYTASTNGPVRRVARHIPQNPDRILDAPELKGDFYLNTLDWSSSNLIAVALGQTVYLWNAASGDINELCSTDTNQDDYISSVSWLDDGVHVAVGTASAQVQIWDASQQRKIRTMTGHRARVGALSWNEHILSSGSKTGAIFNSDVRIQNHQVASLTNHTQEVCGLKWSADGKTLASGGNDNVVSLWNANGSLAHSLNAHTSAVKALAWCPWQPSLLATGGGTADHHVRFWNTSSGASVASLDVHAQVSGLAWNREHREIAATAGNSVQLYKYPTLSKVAELNGHTQRVLGLAVSPDCQTVVSSSADETLRFWKCFAADSKKASAKAPAANSSKLSTMIR